MLPKESVDRYRELGALLERKDGPGLLQPFASEEEADVAFLGLRYADVPARVRGENRLEELRTIAAARGIPEELLRDAIDGDGAGFADRLMTITSSDETRDRYGDRILVFGTLPDKDGKVKRYGQGWQTKTYMAKNPVFMAFHQYTPSMSSWPYAGIPAGQALDTWSETDGKRNRLRKTILWDNGDSQPIAPKLMAGYKARSMRSFSVGFLPEKYYMPQDPDERAFLDLGPYGCIYGQCELLETSAVAIPANPNCTDEKMLAGARAFAADVEEVAPELARQILDGIPTGRGYWTKPDKESVLLAEKKKPDAPEASKAVEISVQVEVDDDDDEPDADDMPDAGAGVVPECMNCGGQNLTCRDCGQVHNGDKGGEGMPPADETVPEYPGLEAAVESAVSRALASCGMVSTAEPPAGASGALERLMEDTREARGDAGARTDGAAGSTVSTGGDQGSQEVDPYREKLLEDVLLETSDIADMTLDRA